MELPSSPRTSCCLWQSSKKEESSKSYGIYGINSYYSDYGLDDKIFSPENGAFPLKQQKIMVQEAIKKHEKATKEAKKGLKFGVK